MVLLGGAALGLAACQSNRLPDLSEDPGLYRGAGYRSRLPGDMKAFVAPLADERGALPASSGSMPIHYVPGGAWNRPMRAMVEDVLRDELVASDVFAGITHRASPDGLIVFPTLVEGHAGQMESAEGTRTFAGVGLRLEVHGPAGGDGGREVLFGDTWSQEVRSPAANPPPSPRKLLGRALEKVLATMLEDLDTSNVARRGVPVKR